MTEAATFATLVDANKLKRDKLRDIIRRVIANPTNVDEVADEIARDWFPLINVTPQGVMEIIVGSGQKR